MFGLLYLLWTLSISWISKNTKYEQDRGRGVSRSSICYSGRVESITSRAFEGEETRKNGNRRSVLEDELYSTERNFQTVTNKSYPDQLARRTYCFASCNCLFHNSN